MEAETPGREPVAANKQMLCAFQIEIIVRELDYVLYQALHLAEQGFSTLLGDHMVNRYIMESDGPLIYFDSDQQEAVNSKVLNNGGAVINLNSELQGYIDDPSQMQENFIKVINHVSTICLGGVAQIEPLSKIVPKERINDLVVTGHPSFDLASPRFIPYYSNNNIVAEYGDDYILINTSFGMFNHEMGFDNYVKMLSKMSEWEVYTKQDHLEHLRKRCAHEERTAKAMIELAQDIAKNNPSRHVVIRPHPAEDVSYYKQKTVKFDNISVTKKYTVREWISKAGAVIHHDCTTGLEALLMDKLIIQYQPHGETGDSSEFMNNIGARATNPEEALKLIASGTMPEGLRDSTLERLSPSLDHLNGNSAKKLAKQAASYNLQGEGWKPQPQTPWGEAKCWRKYISKLLRARQPGRNGRKVRYALNKFSRLTESTVVEKIEKLRAIEPTLPEVNVVPLCLNNFLITP